MFEGAKENDRKLWLAYQSKNCAIIAYCFPDKPQDTLGGKANMTSYMDTACVPNFDLSSDQNELKAVDAIYQKYGQKKRDFNQKPCQTFYV